jgi:hypothetical protein
MRDRRAECPAGLMAGRRSGFERLPLSPTRGGAEGVTGQMVGSGEGGGQ